MNKRILVIGLALALGGVSTAAFAAEPGQFYIGAGVGQAQWDLDVPSNTHLDDTDSTANVRFGYVWHWGVDFAVEGGYASLGEVQSNWSNVTGHERARIKSRGLFGGVKVKYGFARSWYIDGRVGLYQGKIEEEGSAVYEVDGQQMTGSYSYDETDTGWYAGVGFGYDVSRQFSVGLNYDYFHNEIYGADVNVGAVTVSGEYRF